MVIHGYCWLHLIKAYAIDAIMKIYPEIKDRKKVMNFIKEQLAGSNPKKGMHRLVLLKHGE